MSRPPVNLNVLSIDPKNTENPGYIAVITLDRPEVANAFNDEMIEAIKQALLKVKATPHIRVTVLRGNGKHFSAGADLNWMKAAQALSHQENIKDASALTDMFESLKSLPMPTIAVVGGAAFGGAVGLIACCDHVIATESAKLSLSEVKVGILPAVILPYLARKISRGSLRSLALSGRVFYHEEAFHLDLVQTICKSEHLEATLQSTINDFLVASPDAQLRLKMLFDHVDEHSNKQGIYTAVAIADARSSPSGQHGLSSFLDKSKPNWSMKLNDETKLTQ